MASASASASAWARTRHAAGPVPTSSAAGYAPAQGSIGAPVVLRSEDLLDAVDAMAAAPAVARYDGAHVAPVSAMLNYGLYNHASALLQPRAQEESHPPLASERQTLGAWNQAVAPVAPVAPRGYGHPGGLPGNVAEVRHVDGIQAADEDLSGCRMQ